MNFKALEHPDKLRGGYYTPEAVARFLVAWGVQPGPERVLEPACGDGALLRPLLAQAQRPRRVDAVEWDPEAADAAEPTLAALRALGVDARLHRGDGLCPPPGALAPGYDLVLGNPPYIRYQYIEPAMAQGARRVVEAAGLGFTRHTNTWMPFLLDGLGRLREGGRLAMVVPAELLSVSYAAPLRAWLGVQPLDLRILTFRRLLFRGLSQEVVLVLAQRRARGEARLRLEDLHDAEALEAPAPGVSAPAPDGEAPPESAWPTPTPPGKWTVALLREPQRRALERLEHLPRFDALAEVCVGVVTGANNFFCATEAERDRYALEPVSRPLLGRAAQAPGLEYTAEDHHRACTRDQRSWLVTLPDLPEDALPEPWRAWLALGEAQGLPSRFKCRIRRPWWAVPSVWAAPLALFKRCDAAPRLLLNGLEAVSTDTAYRVRPRDPVQARALAVGFCSSATALSAELGGRSYGGGVLELIPSEIRLLRVPPAPAHLFAQADALLRARAPLEELHALVDPWALGEGLGLDEAELAATRQAWAWLSGRRRGRR